MDYVKFEILINSNCLAQYYLIIHAQTKKKKKTPLEGNKYFHMLNNGTPSVSPYEEADKNLRTTPVFVSAP